MEQRKIVKCHGCGYYGLAPHGNCLHRSDAKDRLVYADELRDRFAMVALTGYLACGDSWADIGAEKLYRIAEEMLIERGDWIEQ